MREFALLQLKLSSPNGSLSIPRVPSPHSQSLLRSKRWKLEVEVTNTDAVSYMVKDSAEDADDQLGRDRYSASGGSILCWGVNSPVTSVHETRGCVLLY